MKIGFISFFSDFSDFIYNVQKSSDHEFINYCVNLGAFSKSKINGVKSKLLLYEIRRSEVAFEPSASETKWISEFLVENKLPKEETYRLAKLYFNYFQQEMKNLDGVIVVGDTRLQSRAMILAARRSGTSILFFEQGPYGTTILDTAGVNFTASFANRPAWMRVTNNPTINIKARPRRQASFTFRAMDLLTYEFGKFFSAYDLYEEKSAKKRIKSLARNKLRTTTSSSSSKTEVLVIGQVPTDANFLIHSKYSTHHEFIVDCQQKFPGMNITFREHPLYRGMYEKVVYDEAQRNVNFTISNEPDLFKELDSADYVCTVNSTVGLEVLLKLRKKPIVFGNASYGSFSLSADDTIDPASLHLNTDEYESLVHWFNENFIPEHFRDFELSIIPEFIDKWIASERTGKTS